MSARGPPPDWLSFLAGLRPAHNDRADRPILRWQACRGQVNVKCSAAILLAHRALPDAIHPLHRRRPVAPPATPELLCLSVAVADEIRFACLCATLVVLRQSLTVAPRNLNAYVEGMQLTLGFEQGDITVHIPDLGGETLRLLVEDRVWHPRLQDTIAASNAMLPFLHPEKLSLPMTIAMADKVLSGLQSPSGTDSSKSADGQDAERSTALELPEFRAVSACTVAKCIDALENILTYQRTRWPIRLGIVISAWDTVEGSPTPASWLKDRAPALDSFASANPDMIEWSLYGVSAQGGKLPAQKDELLALGSVRNRVSARNASGAEVPLTDPLRWALWK